MAKVTYRGISYDTENRPNKTVRAAEHVRADANKKGIMG